jgi:hypothetical protein
MQALNRRARKKLVRYFSKIKTSHSLSLKVSTLNIKFIEKIIDSPEFNLYLPKKFKNDVWLLQQADLVSQNCFDLLGSGQKCFTKIPWQQDFKTGKSGKNWGDFYQNITASCPKTMNLVEYNPDIKIPWELSRFQHIFVLGKAYQISSKESQSRYAKAFQSQASDWIDSNPYLIGVNWACPMDVAIRAINWIWGFYFFQDSCEIPPEFWEKFIDSLHKHLQYLEFNWETSDKPNNHYISDLVGYLYLCEFFSQQKENLIKKEKKLQKKKIWCIETILEQFFHQINADGTCYEGSTNYHRLDTELFLHFKLICSATQAILPQDFLIRLEKMIKFVQDCTDECSDETCNQDNSTNFISIGDNDSGKILTGIECASSACIEKSPNERQAKLQLHNYSDFGLLIIKKNEPRFTDWHITFRYPAFKKNQPSGHFHHDELAVTLSIGGVPILVDAGTYVYTANNAWRNLMRSPQSHNTFCCPEQPDLAQTNTVQTNPAQTNLEQTDLFQLNLKPQKNTLEITQTDCVIQATACNKKMAYRMLELNCNQKNLKITDWWNTQTWNALDCHSHECDNKIFKSEWNLIFDTELELKKESSGNWLVTRYRKAVCRIFSTLDFAQTEGFYSKNYGQLQICPKLVATKNISTKNLLNKNFSDKEQIIFMQI